MNDIPLQRASYQIATACEDASLRPMIESFFDEDTCTVSYVVYDAQTREAALIDTVLTFKPESGRVDTQKAQLIADFVSARNLKVTWLLETHAHADHLSAAHWLQAQLGGVSAISAEITQVQDKFKPLYNDCGHCDPERPFFNRHLIDGDVFRLGRLDVIVLHVPGHTPADVAFVVGDAVFTGDTLLMPDCGTARADFPGGDPRALYHSVQRLLALPDQTRLFLCHDYKAAGRDFFCWETTVACQKAANIHVKNALSEEAFVALRTARDATLAPPKLMLAAMQVNIRGGQLPEPEKNGVRYMKLPVNTF